MQEFERSPAVLDTEEDDQDEDFLAPEVESGTCSDSEDAEDSDSDSDSETLPPKSLPHDFRATLLQALEGELALPDEPILSESEISKEFSEEEDDEDYVLQILGGEVSLPKEGPSMLTYDKEVAHNPTSTSEPSTKKDCLAEPQEDDLRSILEKDAEAIAKSISKRTRAHMPLDNITIEELEAQLNDAPFNEPLLFFGVDDAEEYEKFLASLDLGPLSTADRDLHTTQVMASAALQGDGDENGNGNENENRQLQHADGDHEEDSEEDEDFLMELERMCYVDDGFEDPFELSTFHSGQHRKRKVKPVKPSNKPPNHSTSNAPKRRSQRLLARSAEARPLFAAKTYNRQQAAHAVSLLASGPQHFALAAAYAMSGIPPPFPSAIAPLGRPIAQQPPQFVQLPSQHPAALTALATTVTWHPPPHKYFRTDAAKESLLAQSSTAAPAVPIDGTTGFHPVQYAILHTLIHQHVQLTCQTIALAVAEGEYVTANAAGLLLQEFLEFSMDQGQQRQRSGYPTSSYTPGSLVLLDPIIKHMWAPGSWNLAPGPLRYTVADVPILQGVPDMLDELERAVQETFEELSNDPSLENEPQCLMRLDGSGKLKQLTNNKKQLRKPKRNMEITWRTLAPEVAHALEHVKWYFDSALEPKVVRFRNTAQTMFTPAEDALLAWGLRKYGYDWERIAKEFLPNKTDPLVLFRRKKNRSSSNASDNVIKTAVSFLNAPITPAEHVVIEKALQFYGKQPFKWETICKEHLPYRHPHVLSMLWGKHIGASSSSSNQESQQEPLLNPALLVTEVGGGFPDGGETFFSRMWGTCMVPGDQNYPVAAQNPMTASDHGDVWTADEEKLVLTRALQSGGSLSPAQLRLLADEMQREEDCIVRRCEVLVERFRSKVREKRVGGETRGS